MKHIYKTGRAGKNKLKINIMSSQTFSFVKVFSIILFISAVSVSCQKSATDLINGSKGISLFLTDDPSMVFDNIFVDIQKVEIKAENEGEIEKEHSRGNESKEDDDKGSTSGEWITLSSRPKVYDILKYRNGLDTLLATGSFQSVSSIRKVRITFGSNNKAISNGVTSPLSLKKNVIVLDIKDDMVEQATGHVNLWLDLDGSQSVKRHGNELELEPGMKAFSKEKAGSIAGRVMPADAKAIVMAINGTDTATAKPEREGEFKIMGLKAGTYKLLVHATENNYVDASQNIVVRTKEDSHAGTISLHK